DQTGDEMSLGCDLERIAQSGNLIDNEILDDLARPLYRIFALHHEIEIEIVDERDQNTGQAFMDAKYTLQARHLAFAASPILEIGKLDQRGGPVPQTVELGLLGKFGELLLRAACCRREAVLQEHEDRFRRGERACRKEPGDE